MNSFSGQGRIVVPRTIVIIFLASVAIVACDLYSTVDHCRGIECNDHGECVVNNGEPVCICEEGYAGELCEERGEGYYDDGDECVENESCDEESCSGHGTCDNSTGKIGCTCNEGYAGDQCELCDHGFQNNDNDGVCRPDCATSGFDCGLHGVCEDATGTASCVCVGCWGGPGCSVSLVNLDWVSIPGGTFMMGSEDSIYGDEEPVHQVTVPAFEMSRTEVTISQYRACVDAGVCSEPESKEEFPNGCNWEHPGREEHPVNCVDAYQAADFCACAGGRLPSEAEWEYAARSGGKDITHPWGEDTPSCTYAVMSEGTHTPGIWGCGEEITWPVCSKPAGNTDHGLCDMSGNVEEIVQDCYHPNYQGAPSDGSAWVTPDCTDTTYRSGNYTLFTYQMRATWRDHGLPTCFSPAGGIRCAR